MEGSECFADGRCELVPLVRRQPCDLGDLVVSGHWCACGGSFEADQPDADAGTSVGVVFDPGSFVQVRGIDGHPGLFAHFAGCRLGVAFSGFGHAAGQVEDIAAVWPDTENLIVLLVQPDRSGHDWIALTGHLGLDRNGLELMSESLPPRGWGSFAGDATGNAAIGAAEFHLDTALRRPSMDTGSRSHHQTHPNPDDHLPGKL